MKKPPVFKNLLNQLVEKGKKSFFRSYNIINRRAATEATAENP
jgi:hypothetical protein